jgi:hypothetical protein
VSHRSPYFEVAGTCLLRIDLGENAAFCDTVALFSIKNLVLRVRSEFKDLVGKDCELFWSTGVLECWQKRKQEFQLELVLSLLHYSTTPSLQQTVARGERLLKPAQRAAPKPDPAGRILYLLELVKGKTEK